MQALDAALSQLMYIIDNNMQAPNSKTVLLERVRELLVQGASLTPYIERHLGRRWLEANNIKEWLDLGFDLNTQLDISSSHFGFHYRCNSGTLLDFALRAAFSPARNGPEIYEPVELLCSRGARITREMYMPRPDENGPVHGECRAILRRHATKQVLVVLVGVIHPHLVGVLKGFLM